MYEKLKDFVDNDDGIFLYKYYISLVNLYNYKKEIYISKIKSNENKLNVQQEKINYNKKSHPYEILSNKNGSYMIQEKDKIQMSELEKINNYYKDIIKLIDIFLQKTQDQVLNEISDNINDMLYDTKYGLDLLIDRNEIKELLASYIINFSNNYKFFIDKFSINIFSKYNGIGKTKVCKTIFNFMKKSMIYINNINVKNEVINNNNFNLFKETCIYSKQNININKKFIFIITDNCKSSIFNKIHLKPYNSVSLKNLFFDIYSKTFEVPLNPLFDKVIEDLFKTNYDIFINKNQYNIIKDMVYNIYNYLSDGYNSVAISLTTYIENLRLSEINNKTIE